MFGQIATFLVDTVVTFIVFLLLARFLLQWLRVPLDRKSTRLNSSHSQISYAVFCLKKKKKILHERDKLKELIVGSDDVVKQVNVVLVDEDEIGAGFVTVMGLEHVDSVNASHDDWAG